MKKRLNVVYIIADQLRYDFIGVNGNKYIDTPNLDMMAKFGINFKNAYCAVPSCIAARAAIHTGLSQENHKRVGYEDGVSWDYDDMLAEVFTKNGYHTSCVGKMHVYPNRKLCGFNEVILHDGYLHESRKTKKPYFSQYENTDDYLNWIKGRLTRPVDLTDLGLSCNSWDVRAWQMDEYLHPTNWVTENAIDFLRRRDPTKPFFLNISYVAPHSPLMPPSFYYDEYKNRDVKMPIRAGWNDENTRSYDIDAKYGRIEDKYLIKQRRAYSAMISHLDHQIRRFFMALDENDLLDDTIVVFSADHGDMLGDHNFLRKSLPYEGSSHIPLIIYDRGKNIIKNQGLQYDQIVELRDIYPSLLDFCGLDIPKGKDGISLKNIIDKKDYKWRDFIHGEHTYGKLSNHFITDGKVKYIWYSQDGREEFFDLEKDRQERINLINDPTYKKKIDKCKKFLIKSLENRPEGYVNNKKLIVGQRPLLTLE